MAKANIQVLSAIRNTIGRIEQSNQYQWGHMGACNCGFLAQEITHLTKDDIHSRAMQRYGDWNEQLNDYCPTSGLPIDDLISEMLAFGFDSDDLKHLEKLSDPKVLNLLPFEERNLRHNVKNDVLKYLQTWSSFIECQILETIKIDDISLQGKVEI